MGYLPMLLKIAGGVQIAILLASTLVPKVLSWRDNLAALHPFLRRLFWVYGVFIALVVLCFGVLTLCFAGELAAGGGLGRGLAGFIGIFWSARLIVQFFVFDPRPFLTNGFYRLGYRSLTAAFVFLVIVYAMAAIR